MCLGSRARFCWWFCCRPTDRKGLFRHARLQTAAPLKPFFSPPAAERVASLIPVASSFCFVFLVSPPPSDYSESRRSRSSTCHPLQHTDPTFNLHVDFVQLFCPRQREQAERHAQSAPRCQTETLSTVYRAAPRLSRSWSSKDGDVRDWAVGFCPTLTCSLKAEAPNLLE